ncbi:MAG: glycosyltransferase [Thermodesulfobacteriota bacterium]|nr:glycosyltransferase [Thermodesulfobacteriota bacterium]
MLSDFDIIYVAGHDFNLTDSKISTDHIAEQLSKNSRLLYVESIGIRNPHLNKNDMKRILIKVKNFFRLPRRINKNLYVLTPIAIPFHKNTFIQNLNEILLSLSIRVVCFFLRFRKRILFVFLPTMNGVVGKVGEQLSIYYCTDEHAEFPGVDRDSIRKMELELLNKVDLGFATALQILESKKKINPNFYLSTHGVDFDHFARAQDPDLPVPKDAIHFKKPIIGYFGAIDRWMDFDLIEYLVRKKKDWTFLFVGKYVVDLSRFSNYSNLYFLGQRPFQELPRYGKIFDVAIVPFRINKLTEYVFPIKLKEYLSMGKPVVTSALPPVEVFNKENRDIVHIGYNDEDFLMKIEGALLTNIDEQIRARQESVKKDTWESRVKELSDVIESFILLQ